MFTGIAAVAGGFINLNFMLAGSVSSNPVLLLLALLLVMAWKTAGYLGVDNILLPRLGTPWHAQTSGAAGTAPANLTPAPGPV